MSNVTSTEALEEQVQQLRAQVAALEQLLEVYEQETLDKSDKLERALIDLQHHAQQLSYSEDALRVLKSILSSMGEGVVVADETGKLLFCNPAAEKILDIDTDNFSLERWLGQAEMSRNNTPQGIFLPDGVTPCPIAQFPLVQVMNGGAVEAAEVVVRSTGARSQQAQLKTDEPSPETDQTGTELWLSVTARPLQDSEGTVRGGVAVFHNITSQKQAEAALRRSEAYSRSQAQRLEQTLTELQHTQAQLVQTEKMSSLGQMVAGIAHEINNPVNFIYGNVNPAIEQTKDLLYLLELYQQHYPQPHPEIQTAIEDFDLEFLQDDLPKLLRSMHLGADRIRQIVLSLRNFSRLDEAEMKPVNIHDGIDSTLLILQNRLKATCTSPGVEIKKHYGDLPLVECYAGQLNQVFMNILSNAIDALESYQQQRLLSSRYNDRPSQPSPATPGCITITTEIVSPDEEPATSLTPSIRIRIGDNGPGIPAKVQQRLFDPFFTTKPVGKGTGLGLYISHQIVVDKHQGILKCVSAPGQGTEFWIEIPMCPAIEGDRTPSLESDSLVPSSTLTPHPAP